MTIISDLFRATSVVALLILALEFIIIAKMAVTRMNVGKNGDTRAIFFWSSASVIYIANELVRIGIMRVDYIYRGEIAVVGAALTRALLVIAVSYFIYTMYYPPKGKDGQK